MAYGLQLAGCGIFLVEQFSGISAVLKPNPQKQQSPRISVEASFCMVPAPDERYVSARVGFSGIWSSLENSASPN